jgi:glutathione peroxidase
MKIVTAFLVSLLMMNLSSDSFYSYSMKNIDGADVSLENYKGKVLLVVNTASKCGYTPQYEGLQEIYEKYSEQGLEILGFPANNFMGQEPGTDEEIKEFCSTNYSVAFPMFSKVSVKGKDQHALFSFLTSQENPDFTGDIKWNFEKFLVDKKGQVVDRYASTTTPESLASIIEKHLAA